MSVRKSGRIDLIRVITRPVQACSGTRFFGHVLEHEKVVTQNSRTLKHEISEILRDHKADVLEHGTTT